jgi:parallel beta-helix repeat protein
MKTVHEYPVRFALALALIAVTAFAGHDIFAANLCVNPGGTSGCYKTIGAAVAAASANDTIRVSPGKYSEDVTIGKPLSLLGTNSATTIIDALGLGNGIYVDGIDNKGLRNVVISGFTIRNANYEGILVTNASFITIWRNHLYNNDKNLNPATPACPALPAFETEEGFDCGEAIHLSGVDHSTVASNQADHNAGGILLSDDTGPTHDNLITGNVAADNPFDCGITMASHVPAMLTNATKPFGVFRNTIAGNTSTRNGLGVAGAGAGVGIFAPNPGTQTYSNVVIGNRLIGNGLPGVAFHSHAPGQNLDDNVIVANYIAGNGADTQDAATPGPTGINVFGVSPITGTIISQNIIQNEAVDIAVNTGAPVDAHLNNLLGNGKGVDNIGSGTVNATENWWGCPAGPGFVGCSTVAGTGVIFTPWLTTPVSGPEG